MEQLLETKITKVTVFPDRARVTCGSTMQVSPEIDTLLFDELPLSMEPDSVRVRGEGTMQVRILGVDVATHHYEAPPSPRIEALQAELTEVNQQLLGIADDLATWEAEALLLDGLRGQTGAYAKGLARGRMTVQDQNELMLYIRTQDREVRKEQRALRLKAEALERRQDRLERELGELRDASPRLRYQVRVGIEAESTGSLRLELTYAVNNASWQPLYDLHYDPAAGRSAEVAVTTYAEISQYTGQDWVEVSLSVSTARPALTQRKPELMPWFIDVYHPPVPLHSRPSDPRMAKMERAVQSDLVMSAPAIAAPVEHYLEAEQDSAVTLDDNAVINFNVAGTTTLAGDGNPRKVMLGRQSLPVSLRYLSVPKHTDAVYRQLTVTNSGTVPLLPGPANLFVDGDYIGKTDLEFTAAGGEREILLGVEERIEVERELNRRSADKKFLQDQRVLTYGYEIKLMNRMDEAVHVEVHEHIPVARHEEIHVKLGDTRPAPSEHTSLNLLEWQVDLERQGESVISYEYTVQYPRSLNVSGLID